MKDKIEVGEYVRTKTGNITKVISIKDSVVWTEDFIDIHCEYNEGIIEKKDIIKHSKNIIDLIEIGDYVNGKKIESIIEGNWKSEGVAERILCFEIDFPIEKGLRAYHNCDIKSIVTKEQFKEMEYRV